MALPPAPPVPRNEAQQQTAYTNASYWTDWYEKLRYIVNNSLVVTDWADIINTPTTLAGYGITDGLSTSRTINTTAPLTGGGDLSADRTFAITQFSGTTPGSVPTSLGGTTDFLRADGSWAVPPGSGGSSSWTEIEVDFGSTPVYESTFTITDALITSSAVTMQVLPCGKAATGRTADDWVWDSATFAANPGTGSATCYAVWSPGPIVGKRKIQYLVG